MRKLLFLIAALFVLAMPAVAQTGTETQPVSLVAQYFTNLAALAGAVLIVTQFALKYVKTNYDQVISWVVAVGLSAVGWLLKLGVFAGLEWWSIVVYGFASGLVANGLFDVGLVNMILNYFMPKAKLKAK